MKKWLFCLMGILFLFGCSPEKDISDEETGMLREIRVVLDWTPNTNHTGLYVAKENGYFKDNGLDVEIILPGEAGADSLVASGKADFGVSYQESVTEARVQDVPLVSIGAVIQHNTSGFASLASDNIITPKDFEGKVYGGWGAPLEKAVLTSIMTADDADIDLLDIINMGDTDFFTAMQRDIDFAWIYYAWTGVEAELRGEELNMVYLTDYSTNLDYYTPVLTTNEQKISEEPDVVEAFMNAVSKGYNYAIDHPEKAAEILIEAEPSLDPNLVKESQIWLAPKYQDDAHRWGEQSEAVWQNYADWMFERGLLEKEVDTSKAFTNEFLPIQEDN